MRTCRRCGASMEGRRPQAKYCSHLCLQHAYLERRGRENSLSNRVPAAIQLVREGLLSPETALLWSVFPPAAVRERMAA